MRWPILLLSLLATSLFTVENPLLPNAKIELATPQLGEGGLVSFLGELGARNLRGALTYANQWTSCQRFKASGEFLTQDLKISSEPRKWVSQYSLGAEYQILFSTTAFRDLYARGIYIHSYHKGHGAHRIAGADGGQGRLGTTLSPWKCAYLSAEIDYDYVNYHRTQSHRKIVSGFGGSTNFVQYLGQEFSVRGDAEFHRPYFFYEGALNWTHDFPSCTLHTGLYMNYTQGMQGLPNVLGGGIEISLSFGGKSEKCCRAEPEQNYCDEKWMCDLSSWALESAARVPIVLAISDPLAAASCTPPTSRPIPNQNFSGSPTYSFDASPFFSSSTPLTYSATGLPLDGSINSSTGVISGPSPRTDPVPVTITATSACGSTSQIVTLIFF